MSQRSAGVFSIRIHPRMKPDKFLDVADFNGSGADVLVLMRALLAGLPSGAVRDDLKKRYVSIENLDPAGRRLTITADVGLYNTPGSTKNVDHHVVEHDRGDRSAATVRTRLVMLSPLASTVALLYNERVGQTHAGSAILDLFTKALQTAYPEYVVNIARIFESEAWLAAAQLEEVSAAAYSREVEPADKGLPTARGRLVSRFVPLRGTKAFPSWVWARLRAGTLKASDLFAIDDLEDDVTVTLAGDGRRKSFVLGKEKLPSASYLLSESGEQMMETRALWSTINDLAAETFKVLGSQWSPSFASAVWTPEQLAVTLAPPE